MVQEIGSVTAPAVLDLELVAVVTSFLEVAAPHLRCCCVDLDPMSVAATRWEHGKLKGGRRALLKGTWCAPLLRALIVVLTIPPTALTIGLPLIGCGGRVDLVEHRCWEGGLALVA